MKASDNVFPQLIAAEGAAPATPAAGTVVMYAKTDGLLYSKDDAGAETALSVASGGGAVSSVNGATGAVVLTAADVASAVVSEATSARTIDPATDAGKYIRYTGTGAKTCTFDDGDGFGASEEFHIANRGASGDVTLTPAGGMTLNAPKGGSLVLEPGDTVTVKMVAADEADVMGSTA